jgi:hypothetical protein
VAEYFTPTDNPYGFSYGHWTVKWWQWLLSVPRDYNPCLDKSGNNTEAAQDNPNVAFLTGTFVNSIKTPFRKITLSSQKAILIPAINFEANFLEDPKFKNDNELKEFVAHDIDDIVLHSVYVDEQNVPTYRVKSDPLIFPITIAEDLPHGVNGEDSGGYLGPGGKTEASADGYWAFLRPLSKGEHSLHLHGSCAAGARRTEAYYNITIV